MVTVHNYDDNYICMYIYIYIYMISWLIIEYMCMYIYIYIYTIMVTVLGREDQAVRLGAGLPDHRSVLLRGGK